MEKHFDLLGRRVTDVMTGFAGVVESISFDLYGCVQAIVRAPAAVKPETGSQDIPEGRWFDVKRLTTDASAAPVMPRPDFSVPEIGGAAKPAFPSRPLR